jgi:CHAT domain-containing protein
LPSATALTLLPPAKPFNGAVAVVADPVYELSDGRFAKHGATSSAATRSLDEIRFARLRFSGQESAAIARLTAPGASLNMIGFGASRNALLAANLDPYSILHVATHAITYPTQPELSAIVLSLYDQRGVPVDGFLHMYEVAGMRLNSQLVVLSACDTALGRKLEGEGPLGISRTFLSAGASGVVATLWAVDDAATAQFMTAFYRGILKEKLTPAAAHRSAQFFVRSQARWANPYYWAGFIYTGS